MSKTTSVFILRPNEIATAVRRRGIVGIQSRLAFASQFSSLDLTISWDFARFLPTKKLSFQ